MRYTLDKVLDSADANLAGVTSDAIIAASFLKASAVAVVVGAGTTGNLTVQVSNDPLEKTQGPTHWVSTSHTVAVTGPGTFLIPAFDCSYAWIRLAYVKTAGAPGSLISVYLKSDGY